MVDPRDVFPDRLEDRLQRAGMTDRDLADALGVDEPLVDSWLDGRDFPCPRRFDQLLAVLGVSRDELLT